MRAGPSGPALFIARQSWLYPPVIPGRRASGGPGIQSASSPTSAAWIPGSRGDARPGLTTRARRFAIVEKGKPLAELLEAAVIGTGWCGGIRAETLSRSALCKKLHICEIRPDRLAEVKALTNPATATLDYRDILANDDIAVVYVCTTPENTHFPITRDCLRAGKHVLLEKPIAMELFEADELIALAKRAGVKFTIGYSQRFNTKIAYARKKIADGTLGRPVSLMVSRHLSRSLGKRIAGRTRLSPAAMESTHDLDFAFWLLEPAKPVRVYSQGAYGYMKEVNGSFDIMWTTVTMDNGALVAIGGGWNLPPSYPNYCATSIEITGTEGSLFLDDSQRDNWLNTVGEGTRFPMSTMPGEQVDHVFAGQMGPETLHFLEQVMLDRPPMVTPESARRVMECYIAADLSAERGEPIDIPLNNEALAAVQDLYKKFRTPV
jgi:predicted dehydrogenase